MDGRKKLAVLCMLSAVLALGGCSPAEAVGSAGEQGAGSAEDIQETIQGPVCEAGPDAEGGEDKEIPEQEPVEVSVTQGGPYGEVSMRLPAGWDYELCPIDSPELRSCLYGIHFYPEGVEDGFIEAGYVDDWGICGTGLFEEQRTFAGKQAMVGTYDGHAYWDFVDMTEGHKGLVAVTISVESWWEEYGEETFAILDTLSFDPDVKEGGASIYGEDCRADEIGLQLSLKNITSTGATLVFLLYDEQAPQGELTFGADFTLEVLGDEGWESVQPLPGNYGFDAIGYILSPETAKETVAGNYLLEQEIGWEWMYGELPPGTYRIGKTVSEQRAEGFQDYLLYAGFLLN